MVRLVARKDIRFVKHLFQGISKRARIIFLIMLASLLLSGCVKYDVGVNFNNSNYGEFVQHIHLGERLTTFSGDSVYEWLDSIERRARKLDGKTRRLSREEVVVTIPFNNAEELQTKFNQFFNPNLNEKGKYKDVNTDLPKIESNILLFQNNFLLLVRNKLIYDLDLSSLALISNNGNVLANAGSILDLQFSLKTPWGAKINNTTQQTDQQTENAVVPETNGKQLTWRLNPGELNHIEVVFWLPSPLGIGALIIILLVSLGIYIRYNLLPDPRIQFAQPVATEQS
ncbi:hypothetical protein NIES4071_61790 [Calothrix sp. NIES-4071]|nr:hypothetical protein NIES4071_61790 [Calothrix sp. NIES-4071]BAZ60483.1 hypothetical protein NIES4105_61740 [Calothrix sp. NIES-4105]